MKYPRIHISMHILQSILKYVTRSWYPVPMCDVRVSRYPCFPLRIRVSAYPLLNMVKSLPGEGWYFRPRIPLSNLFRGAASKWQGILQLSPESIGISLYLELFCFLSFVSLVLRNFCSGTCRSCSTPTTPPLAFLLFRPQVFTLAQQIAL